MESFEYRVKRKKRFRYIFFLIFLIAILLSKAVFFEFYKVFSVSMMDTLLPGDFVLINKLAYGANTPNKITIPFIDHSFYVPSIKLPVISDIKNGDVVVIRKDLPERPEKYIKRCVAVGGQTIEIKKGVLFVDNEQVINQSNTSVHDTVARSGQNDIPFMEVPEGYIFVMGDNRSVSYDSRSFGFVENKDVIGKAMFIYSSIDGKGDFRWDRFFHCVE